MKKRYLMCFVSAALLVSSYSSLASAASDDVDTSAIVKKQEAAAKRKNVKKTSRVPDLDPALFDYNRYVAAKDITHKAEAFHNLIKMLRQEQSVLADYKAVLDDYEDLLARYKANHTCNVSLLSPYYANPEAAWDKLAEQAYAADKLVSVSVSDDASKNKSSTIGLARWNIGYKFLGELYGNPESYGEMKKSFPLWADQKYIYDKNYFAYYASLSDEFKKLGGSDDLATLLAAGPNVPDSVKYDVLRYSALVAAHNNLVTKVSSGKLSGKLSYSKPPMVMKALPPWKEIIYAENWEKDNYHGKVSFNPVTPEPWKYFSDSNFKKFNNKGEMSKVVKVVSQNGDYATIRFNNDVLPLNRNRIERYLILREAESDRRPIAAQVKLVFDAKTDALKKKLSDAGISVSDDTDFSKSEDVEAVIGLIKEKKQTNIDLAKKALESIENLYKDGSRGKMAKRLENAMANLNVIINALDTDKDGMTTVNNLTASDVKTNLAKETANQTLMDKYKEISDANKAELISNQSSWCPIY